MPDGLSRRLRKLAGLAAGAVVLMAVFVFGAPILRDGATGPCAALEARLSTLMRMGRSPAAFDGDLPALAGALFHAPRDRVPDGGMAAAFVAARDDRPAWIGCTARSWSIVLRG